MSKWSKATFLLICFDEETNSSKFWFTSGELFQSAEFGSKYDNEVYSEKSSFLFQHYNFQELSESEIIKSDFENRQNIV